MQIMPAIDVDVGQTGRDLIRLPAVAAEAGGFRHWSIDRGRISPGSFVAVTVGADRDATGRGQPLVGAGGGSPGGGVVALAAGESSIGDVHIVAEAFLQFCGARVAKVVRIPGILALTGAVLAGGEHGEYAFVAGAAGGVLGELVGADDPL